MSTKGSARSKEPRWITLTIAIIALAFITAYFTGTKTPIGYLIFFGMFVPASIAPPIVITILAKKQFFKKVDERELKAEDDILLQATAFSQAALWIYLNLVPQNDVILMLKWLVPCTAILFYCIRAYAKLKNSNKWRYRSIFALFFVVAASVNSCLMVTIEPLVKDWLTIEGANLTGVITMLLMVPLSAMIVLTKQFKVRYSDS